MVRVVFWDVDTQYDFMMPEGRLYVKGAEEIIPNLKMLTDYGRSNPSLVRVMGSVDYHSEGDEEISDSPDFKETFPPHCLIGTLGQEKIDETKPLNPLWIDYSKYGEEELEEMVRGHRGEVYFRKRRFDVFSNPNVDVVLNIVKPEAVVVYGVTLDICDAYAVEGFLRRGVKIGLVEDAVKPISRERGEALIRRWVEAGVKLLKTESVVEEGRLEEAF